MKINISNNMLAYELSYFQTVNSNNQIELDLKIKSIIDNLSSKVTAPNYKKNPHFKKKKKNNNNNLKSIKNNIKKGNSFIKKTKSNITDVRLELNKLTDKNYNEKIENIWEIIKNNEDEDKYNKVVDLLFIISSSNKTWSHLYARFFKTYLLDKNIAMEKHIDHYKELMNSIYDISYENDYQKFCNENKKKDKRLAYSIFIVHLMNEGIIEKSIIVDIIKNELQKFHECIDREKCKDIIEEIINNVIVLTFKGYNSLKNTEEWDELFKEIIDISQMKSKNHVSLTNKTLFKLNDEIDTL